MSTVARKVASFFEEKTTVPNKFYFIAIVIHGGNIPNERFGVIIVNFVQETFEEGYKNCDYQISIKGEDRGPKYYKW